MINSRRPRYARGDDYEIPPGDDRVRWWNGSVAGGMRGVGVGDRSSMMFFVGLHHPSSAQHFERACISRNVIQTRKKAIGAGSWIMDSGAFTTIAKYGGYPHPVGEYAELIRRWAHDDTLLAAVAQDYMCEPHMIERTGLSIAEHQRLTIERYDELVAERTGVAIMPVLQGYAPEEYVSHLRQYGSRLTRGAWVGVGSVCKRNRDPRSIERVLLAIHNERPDLRLHGFGIKLTSLASGLVRSLLYSADSMAWSFAARKQGRSPHDWREAEKFVRRISSMPHQAQLFV